MFRYTQMMICVYEFYFDERDVDYTNKSYIYIYMSIWKFTDR